MYKLIAKHELGKSTILIASLEACMDHVITKCGELDWFCADQLKDRVFYENGEKLYGCPHCCDIDDEDHDCNAKCFDPRCEIVSESLEDDTHFSISKLGGEDV